MTCRCSTAIYNCSSNTWVALSSGPVKRSIVWWLHYTSCYITSFNPLHLTDHLISYFWRKWSFHATIIHTIIIPVSLTFGTLMKIRNMNPLNDTTMLTNRILLKLFVTDLVAISRSCIINSVLPTRPKKMATIFASCPSTQKKDCIWELAMPKIIRPMQSIRK